MLPSSGFDRSGFTQIGQIIIGLRSEENRHDRFDAFPIVVVKSVQVRTIDVQHSHQLPPIEKRNRDFGLRGRIACNMPCKVIDIWNKDRLALCRGTSTNASSERYSRARRLSLKRT